MRKLKPKVRSAGTDQSMGEIITPPRMTSPPSAAAGVRAGKTISATRSRLSALARAATAEVSTASPCSATSTTDHLLAWRAAPRLSPLDSREEPNQSDLSAASQSYLEHTSEQREGPRTAPFPTP